MIHNSFIKRVERDLARLIHRQPDQKLLLIKVPMPRPMRESSKKDCLDLST